MTRALIIDPFRREVREVHDDFDRLAVVREYAAQGERGPKSVTLDGGALCDGQIQLFVDDEGYFRPGQAWSIVGGYAHPLAGYVVLLGRGPRGDDMALPDWLTAPGLAACVTWLSAASAQAMTQPIRVWSGAHLDDLRTVSERRADFSDQRPM